MADHQQPVTVEDNGGSLQVRGALTFETVPALVGLSAAWTVSEKEPVVVDLSGVSHSDSAGLALLLQWLGDVRAAGGDLKFINIPDQVEDFIRINGLAELLVN